MTLTAFIQPSSSAPPAAPTAPRSRASPQLDSKRPLAGDAARRRGRRRARRRPARSTTGAHVADPFRPTAEVVALLRLRAAALEPAGEGDARRWGRWRLRRRCAPREAFPSSSASGGGRRSPDAGRRRVPRLAGVDGALDRLHRLGLDVPGDPRDGRDDAAAARRRRALRDRGRGAARGPRRPARRRGRAPDARAAAAARCSSACCCRAPTPSSASPSRRCRPASRRC